MYLNISGYLRPLSDLFHSASLSGYELYGEEGKEKKQKEKLSYLHSHHKKQLLAVWATRHESNSLEAGGSFSGTARQSWHGPESTQLWYLKIL